LKFIVDAQLPGVLAEWIRFQGFEAIHTVELPDKNKTDDDQLRLLAKAGSWIIISKDRDFLDSHLVEGNPEKLVLVKTGNTSNPELLLLFKNHFPTIVDFLKTNSLVEISLTEITGI